MKTYASLITLVAALLGGTAAGLQAYPKGKPIMAPVSAVIENGIPTVTEGTPRAEALKRLGRDARQLTDNVWLFEKYKASDPHIEAHGCNALMVVFENDQVSRMAVVNEEAILIVDRRPQANPLTKGSTAYAAASPR